MQNTKRMERQADAVNSDGARLLQKRLPSTMKLGAFTTTQDSTDMKTIEQWHGGKARDYESWIIPSALLMTSVCELRWWGVGAITLNRTKLYWTQNWPRHSV